MFKQLWITFLYAIGLKSYVQVKEAQHKLNMKNRESRSAQLAREARDARNSKDSSDE